MKTSRLALLANPSGDVRPRASGSGCPVGDPLSRSRGTAWKFLVVALCYCLLAFAASVLAATVSWDRNPEPDIVRYQVRYGTTSGTYTQTINAGNQTSVAVNGLEPGVIYYITVTAVNEAGLESAPSAEISYQEPAAPLEPATLVPQAGWAVLHVDSEEGGDYSASKAFDGDPATFWHTRWTGGATAPPHEIQIDLGAVYPIEGFRHLPRQDNSSIGNIAQYEFYTSLDGSSWGAPAASGTFSNNSSESQVVFTRRNARFVRLRCLSAADGWTHNNVAELNLLQGATLPNNAPSAPDLAFAAYKNSTCRVTLEGTDPDGDVLSYSIIRGPSHGSLRGNAASWIYQPVAGFSGEDSFVFAASDGSLSAEATVIIRVSNRISGGNNSAPVFKKDPIRASYAVERKSYGGESLATIVEDADKGDVIRFAKTAGPLWLEVSSNGRLSGTPPAGSSGVHRFKVTATDKSGASAVAELIIVIHKDLPLPWDLAAIGETGRSGDAGRSASGALVLTGGGDLAGPSDAGTFAWQILSADGEAVARVASLDGDGPNTRAGIMIRDSLSARSANAFLGINGRGDFRWVCRARAGEVSKSRKAGKGSPRHCWIRMVRKGGEVTAFTSNDGSDWTRVGSVSVDFGKFCYVGLMVSGGKQREATAAFRDVRIRP